MKRSSIHGVAALVFVCSVVGAPGVAFGGVVSNSYHVVPIPNYSGYGGYPGALTGGYPRVAGYDVAWTGWVGPPPPAVGGQREIFRFDGSTTVQVTSTPGPGGSFKPFISPLNRIVYIGDTGTTHDLFMHDMTTGVTTQLTNATARWPMAVTDFADQATAPRITVEVMDQWLGGPWAPTWITVDLWDGAQIVTLNPRQFNHGARVSPQHAVWHASNTLGGGYDVFLYQIASKTTTPMTAAAGTWSWRDPQIDGAYVVWWGTDYMNATQITLCNLNQGTHYRHPVASANTYKEPKLANAAEHVVWSWSDSSGLVDEVWHHAHTPPFPMTTKIFPGGPMDIHGVVDCVVADYPYAAFSVRMPGGGMLPYEVYVYDLVNLGVPQRIGGGIGSGPIWVQLSSKLIPPYGYIPVVVWEENLGDVNTTAYMATRPDCTTCLTADFDDDCGVNSTDMAVMAAHWGQPNTCDLNGDNIVNFADLLILTGQWLQCNIQPSIYCWTPVSFPCP